MVMTHHAGHARASRLRPHEVARLHPSRPTGHALVLIDDGIPLPFPAPRFPPRAIPSALLITYIPRPASSSLMSYHAPRLRARIRQRAGGGWAVFWRTQSTWACGGSRWTRAARRRKEASRWRRRRPVVRRRRPPRRRPPSCALCACSRRRPRHEEGWAQRRRRLGRRWTWRAPHTSPARTSAFWMAGWRPAAGDGASGGETRVGSTRARWIPRPPLQPTTHAFLAPPCITCIARSTTLGFTCRSRRPPRRSPGCGEACTPGTDWRWWCWTTVRMAACCAPRK